MCDSHARVTSINHNVLLFVDVRLSCWGHWYEDTHMFVVAGKQGELPQFILVSPPYSRRNVKYNVVAIN